MPSPILTAAMLASAAAAAQSTLDLWLRDGFWFGNFTVGDTASAMLLVDTGSAQIALNPGVYRPSQSAVPLNTTFDVAYETTHADGSGVTTIHGENYFETVGFGTILCPSLTIASVVAGSDSDSDSSNSDSTYPGDGIIGFGGLCTTTQECPDNSIISTLCNEKKLDSCRFGLALTTNGTGKLILGVTSIQTRLATTSSSKVLSMWHLLGDVLVGGDDDHFETVNEGAPVLLDSGSSTIIGPVGVVKQIFEKSNVEYVIRSTPQGDRLDGYHACDKPPVLGFRFPSAALKQQQQQQPGGTTAPFVVPASTMALADNGNNNCTSILSGFDQPLEQLDGAMLWVLGHPFFQGHYIDFDMRNAQDPVVSIASLENDTPAGSAAIGVHASKVAVAALAGAATVAMCLW